MFGARNIEAKMLFCLIFLAAVRLAFAQPSQYLKDSEMKGFPSSLKQLAGFEKIREHFDYFRLTEAAYASLFYKSYLVENGSRSGYFRMDIISSKKIEIEPTAFPGYTILLNPDLQQGYFSKQPLQVNVRETAVSATIQTGRIGLIFPRHILQTANNERAQALIDTRAVEYHNNGTLNAYHGIVLKETGDFTMEPSFLPGCGIDLTDLKKATVKFLDEEAYEFPFLVFENNRLANFISNYVKVNKNSKIKSPEKYKTALLIRNASAKVTFDKAISCQVEELYFFEDVVAGVIDFATDKKKEILKQLNATNTVRNRGPLQLKPNGDFPTLIDVRHQIYFKIEQDPQSIKMYFITIK